MLMFGRFNVYHLCPLSVVLSACLRLLIGSEHKVQQRLMEMLILFLQMFGHKTKNWKHLKSPCSQKCVLLLVLPLSF